MVVTLGHHRMKAGDSVEPGEIHNVHGLQDPAHSVINVEVTALKNAVGITELPVDHQGPFLKLGQSFRDRAVIPAGQRAGNQGSG